MRYRKPDGRQTDKRGFKTKRDVEAWAATMQAVAEALNKVATTVSS